MAVRGIRTLSRAHQVSLSCRQQSTDVQAGATTIEAARPWEDIPSLPWVPIVGNIALAFKKPRDGKDGFSLNGPELFEKYDPEGVGMLRLHSRPFNPGKGGGRIIYMADPECIETVLRNEGKYPARGSAFDAMKHWRLTRRDVFPDLLGLTVEDGERWHTLRSLVQQNSHFQEAAPTHFSTAQDLMRPKSAMFYIGALEDIADDFLEFVRKDVRESADGMTNSGDLLRHIQYYALESICAITLDVRMGCLKDKPDDDRVIEVMNAIETVLADMAKCMLGPPLFKIHPRLSPPFMRMGAGLDVFADFVRDKVSEARHRMEAAPPSEERNKSVLEKLIGRCGPDSSVPAVIAFDMCVAGIDTTGNTIAFALGFLARNQRAQDKLRQEVQNQRLTETSIGQMKYLSACIKETLRKIPIAGGIARVIPSDLVVGGYRVPAETVLITDLQVSGHDSRHFADPNEFKPERWLRDNPDRDNPNPFSNIVFGHGSRMCIGKRFAELEIKVFLAKLIQNFRLEWAGERPLGPEWEFVNKPDQPVKIRFHPL